MRDLLSKTPEVALELKEHKESGVYVKGLNAFVVKSVGELRNVVDVSGEKGGRMRALGGGMGAVEGIHHPPSDVKAHLLLFWGHHQNLVCMLA